MAETQWAAERKGRKSGRSEPETTVTCVALLGMKSAAACGRLLQMKNVSFFHVSYTDGILQ